MLLTIHQLVDEDGVLYAPTPALLAQCREILDATRHAIEAARLAQCRERLADLRLPRTRAVTNAQPGTALASELFPGLMEVA